MKSVWKYELKIDDAVQPLHMPKGAKVLHVGIQNNALCIWVLVSPEKATEQRLFAVHGTGHPIPPTHVLYVGTVQTPPFVWHLFEVSQFEEISQSFEVS